MLQLSCRARAERLTSCDEALELTHASETGESCKATRRLTCLTDTFRVAVDMICTINFATTTVSAKLMLLSCLAKAELALSSYEACIASQIRPELLC